MSWSCKPGPFRGTWLKRGNFINFLYKMCLRCFLQFLYMILFQESWCVWEGNLSSKSDLLTVNQYHWLYTKTIMWFICRLLTCNKTFLNSPLSLYSPDRGSLDQESNFEIFEFFNNLDNNTLELNGNILCRSSGKMIWIDNNNKDPR